MYTAWCKFEIRYQFSTSLIGVRMIQGFFVKHTKAKNLRNLVAKDFSFLLLFLIPNTRKFA